MNVQIRRILFYTTAILILAGVYYQTRPSVPDIRPQTFAKFASQPISLKVGPQVPVTPEQEIVLNEPIELDFKSRAEIMKIRTQYVNQHRELLEGEYLPFAPIYNQIVDYRPWWGIVGEFCWGPGKHSIDGPSEETRFIANPYILLGIDEGTYYPWRRHCSPSYPQPIALYWYVKDAKAQVSYDISRYFRDKERLVAAKWNLGNFRILDLVNYNARDFGYEYIYASPTLSRNVAAVKDSNLFKDACLMKAYIHQGGSCQYPGGCNNQSPYEPDMRFEITDLPAVLYCKLWKKKPIDVNTVADFVFIINLN